MAPCRCRLCADLRNTVPTVGESRASIAIDALYTADEVASIVKVSRKVVYAMAAAGQLPHPVRMGRRVRFRGADLLLWLSRLDQPGKPS